MSAPNLNSRTLDSRSENVDERVKVVRAKAATTCGDTGMTAEELRVVQIELRTEMRKRLTLRMGVDA
jgi:hypothetical protein